MIGAGCVFMLMLLAGCCSVFDSCDNDNSRYTARKTFDFTISVEGQTELDFSGINGSVKITGWENNFVHIQGERIVRADHSNEAWNELEKLQVDVDEHVQSIQVQTLQPSQSNGREYTINYDISIPKSWSVDLTHVNGNVLIDHIKNSVDLDLTNGETVLNDHRGGLDVRITNGRLIAETELPDAEKWSVSIVNGAIDLLMKKTASATFSVSVLNGSIDVNALPLQNKTQTLKSVSGILGDGKGKITFSVINGTIQVTGVE